MVAEWHCAAYNCNARVEWCGIQNFKKCDTTIFLGACTIHYQWKSSVNFKKSKYMQHKNQFVVHTEPHLYLWPSHTQHGQHKSGKLIRGDPLAQYGLKVCQACSEYETTHQSGSLKFSFNPQTNTEPWQWHHVTDITPMNKISVLDVDFKR